MDSTGPAGTDSVVDIRPSVFLRIREPAKGRDRVATTLIEIHPDGYIPREVGLAADGRLVYVTRPGEYGVWNDGYGPWPPVGSPEFESTWGPLGQRMEADEFESIFAQADATLPHTIGTTPIWLNNLLILVLLLIVAGIVIGIVSAVVHLFAG